MNALYELDVPYLPLRSEVFQHEKESEQNLEVIGPNDTRKCVPNTKIAPYRYICKIVYLYGGSGIQRWTGIMIGPRTVLTVAHWLAEEQPPKPDANGNIKLIAPNSTYVFPGAKRKDYPFNKGGEAAARAASFVPYIDWSLMPATHTDLAVIILQKPLGLDSQWWTFDFHKWPGDTVGTSIIQRTLPDPKTLNLRICGYPRELPNKPSDPCYDPKEKPGSEQYEDANRGVRTTGGGQVVEYLMDTSAGMGGSPVWCDTTKLGRVLAAVHVARDSNEYKDIANRGVVINKAKLSFIRPFCFWPRAKMPPAKPTLKLGAANLDSIEINQRLGVWILANPAKRLASTLNEAGFSRKTQTALQAFQRTMGIRPTGIADKATWNRLQWPF